ncbi:glycoside hydrolase [uncultured Bacteroides sp.]|uniref:glycoside hydrolase n=1 Tax=uncultured Bacteroides sp. TaxID=162156 RepID=UPI00262990FB|nr:glycoside hydrolase [uncultured Bacteroides sp.]
MKNRILLTAALCMSMMAQITAQGYTSLREQIQLAGEWESSLGTCRLPGTTDENRLGERNRDTLVTYQLTRLYPYSGKVIYTREINIPESFRGKKLFLMMERTKPSTLWVDGDSIGSYGHLYAPHRYELPALAVGKHQLKIRIDNSPTSVPKEIQGSHAWTDATQTNWNGILGEFYIEAVPVSYIQSVQVYPEVDKKQALVIVEVDADKDGKAILDVNGYAWNTSDTHTLSPRQLAVRLKKGRNRIELPVNMGDKPLLWSEFHPALYKLNITLHAGKNRDSRMVDFGMRKFEVEGTQFVINGYKTFLRGKHDACVFPLTGYGPMDVASWQRVFRIAKQYGINHYRCHSFTPPRAALEAADIEGIYYQIELPLWGYIKRENTVLNDFLKKEGGMLLEHFGNHPSFMMLGLGNELDVEIDVVREWLDDFRNRDNRHLYCFGSNNSLGWKGPQDGEDFFVTCRVGGGDGYTTHVRASFAYVDAEKGGILNNTRPATDKDYSGAIAHCPRPVVGHENCQFQIYPDYGQIEKYTGVLRPYNLEIFRDRLKENHLSSQAKTFHQATGHFSIECYKADMEYAFRTPGFGGFQLLDLQDYPGQGSALVGILDAFMDSKGIVAPETFYGFCAPLVPLALMKDHCWLNTQPLHIDVALSNYVEGDWNEPVRWSLVSDNGVWKRDGVLMTSIPQGKVGKAGSIDLSLSELKEAQRLTLTLTTGKYRNYYHLWVYPDETAESEGSVHVASFLNDDLRKRLESGASVLLIPDHDSIVAQSVGGMFTPDYWNYSMFKTISENAGKEVSPGTLSILTDPGHPLLKYFPTEYHSDWQWWSITRNSRPMILNTTRGEYRPLIQVIDNIERNHKLGLVFEFAVGKGKLLVCMTDLQAIAGTPEGNQFRTSLLRYMESDAFHPTEQLAWKELDALFHTDINQRQIIGVKNESDYTVGGD